MDKSWGGDTTATVRIRTNDGVEERAAARARARDAREQEREGLIAQRAEARAANRVADAAAREQARTERRDIELRSASGDPHTAAAKRHRSSGRKDVVRDQRDTRKYTTVVDAGRIRELARRGASTAGLAGAFGISEKEVERVLREAQPSS